MPNEFSLRSSAVLYGKGIFTTISVVLGSPFLWQKHWQRLSSNAETVGIDLTNYTESIVAEKLASSIEENRIINGRARITFFDERPSSIWPGESSNSTTLSILTGDVRDTPDNFKITISPYPVNSLSPLAGVKSCNYLENLMASDEAKTRGSHEAIRVNERGRITSGCMSNVFWLKGKSLYTPSLTTGCLPGTTREFVIENIDCKEVEADLDVLNDADAIFLTSAGLGVTQIEEFDSKSFPKTDHPILDVLPKRR